MGGLYVYVYDVMNINNGRFRDFIESLGRILLGICFLRTLNSSNLSISTLQLWELMPL